MFISKLVGGWIWWSDWQMLLKFKVNWMKIEDFRNLADVDLLVNVDLFAYGDHKKQVVEFGDLFGKSCSNFKSVGWKLMILEIRPMLTFWPMFTLKLVRGWIQWPNMQMLFTVQVNWIKIEDFRNFANVDLLIYVDLLANVYRKINRWLNSVSWYANGLQISSKSDKNWGF